MITDKNWKDKNWENLANLRKDYSNGLISKVYSSLDAEDLKVEKNEIVAVVSSDKIDAAGEIVLPSKMDLDRFRKQPGVYFEHNMDALPLGPCEWIKPVENGRLLKAKYRIVEAASDTHKAIATLVREGAYRSHSIGFLSDSPSKPTPQELRYHPAWNGATAVHRSSTLIEFSLVGLPCNDDAVALVVGKSFPKDIVDKLTGKTAATEQATNEVIEAVTKAEVVSTSDMRKKLLEEVAKQVKNIDRDKVIAQAIKQLRI